MPKPLTLLARPLTQLLGRPRLLPWLVLLVSASISLVAWYNLDANQQRAADQHFHTRAEQVLEALEKRMTDHRQILLGGAGLFNASERVSRMEWRRYVETLDLANNYPGILGLGYSQVIKPQDLPAFESQVRAEGFPDFQVKPVGPRGLYTSILLLEPFVGRNLAAFGYDMYSEPTRRAAMLAAARSGQAQLSDRVTLLQETQGPVQAGLLMYLPIYRHELPLDTPQQRLSALQGFVFSPYRVSDLMHGMLGSAKLELDFALFAGTQSSPEQLMYSSHSRIDPGLPPHMQQQLQLFGQTWTVNFYLQPGFRGGFDKSQLLLLLLGTSISLLLFFLANVLAQGRQQALKLADGMTRKLQEQHAHLQRSEERLNLVLKGGNDGWWDLNLQDQSFYASPRAWQMLGYPDEEQDRQPRAWETLLHPDDLKSLRALLEQPDSDAERYLSHECRLLHRDGQSVPVLLRAFVQFDQQHRPQRISGTCIDLTEQKRIDQLKNEFVSTVSHELRTPLTSVAGSLGLVTGGAFGAVPDDMRAMLDIAHQNSLRLSHLINDLLDMDKLIAGKVSFDLTRFELGQQLDECIRSNQAFADQHQVQLVQDSCLPVWVRADAGRVQQVLANFLSNAIKFSPAGAAIHLHSTLRNHRVRVSVSDQGPGIPDNFRAHIFKKFSQADSTDHRQKGGTGLGLAISKELIERMGGQIGFSSSEGQGSSFWFELPVDEYYDLPPLSHSQPNPTSKHSVLVVEDDTEVALLLQTLLERNDYRAFIASTLARARELLAHEQIAAITLDLRLPDGDGLQLLRELRAQPATRDLPVLIVAAANEHGELSVAGGVPALDWLNKPIDPQRLLDSLAQALSGMPDKPRVLHVEDDIDLRQVIAKQGHQLADFTFAGSLRQARQALAEGAYDLVLLDLGLPDGNGLELIEEIHLQHPGLPIVVLSSTELSAEQLNLVEAALAKSRTSTQHFLNVLARLLPAKETSDA